MEKIRKAIQLIISPWVTLSGLAVLLVLTLFGTIDQAENGLYMARQKFIYSWAVMLFGVIPFPGGMLTMWVLALNLIGSTFLRISFNMKSLGLQMMHWGLIVLFAGSFVIYHFARESFLTLEEGQTSNLISDYSEWELAFFSPGSSETLAVNLSDLKAGRAVDMGGWSFTPVRISVNAIKRDGAAGAELLEQPRRNEPEENLPAAVIDGAGGKVVLWGGDGQKSSWMTAVGQFTVSLRKMRTELPFTVKLIDFKKDLHAGTMQAKNYESTVEISDGKSSRQVRIYMNHPLREKGFTLFQSSYGTGANGREASTFAVVKNSGWLLPYVSSFLVFAGLLVHFILMFRQHGASAAIKKD